MYKKERGITLVALVVTIVVLLILAGVSISLVLGNNGIIKRAQDAKRETAEGVDKDKNDITYYETLLNSDLDTVTL